jgi:hypothetical protein
VIDSALIAHAKQGEPRPLGAGDIVTVASLGRVTVKDVTPDLDLIAVQSADGFGFLVFADQILTIERRAS